MMIDVSAGGALMGKDHDEAYALLEEMTYNNFQWQAEGAQSKMVAGMHELDVFMTMQVQLALLTKQLGVLNVRVDLLYF